MAARFAASIKSAFFSKFSLANDFVFLESAAHGEELAIDTWLVIGECTVMAGSVVLV